MAAMSQPTQLRGRDIVCVGFADWETELWTNQHHLMSRLARDNRVLFVESLGLRRPQLAGRDIKRIARRLRRGLAPARPVDGLHVLSPLVLPFHRHRLVRELNLRLLPALVRRAARRLGLERPILWAYVPQAEVLVDALDPSLVVYHCVDDIAAQERIDTASFRAAEARFAARADLVLASAPALAERLRMVSSNVLDAPNVADTELFSRALGPVAPRLLAPKRGALDPEGTLGSGAPDPGMAALPAPRIVFTGAIVALKLNLPLLVELARLRRSWSFALVGPVGPGEPNTDISALTAEPNIHLLGPRSYTELPDVLRAADAGLIPYARNALTESIFPMKVYEYLAAGLPVVATPLPALAGVADVATAPDARGIAKLLDDALAADSPERRAERSRAAASHSWDRRLEEIAVAIAALPTAPGRDRRGAIRSVDDGRRHRGRDLLVSTHTPVLRSGQAMRTYGIARALAEHGGLDLLYVRFGAPAPDAAFKAIPGVRLHEVVPSRGLRRLLAYATARLEGVPDGFARGISRELASETERLASDPTRGRVIADGPIAAAALASLARRRPVIYNAHNLESGFRHELDQGAIAGVGRRRLRSFERGLLKRSSEAWMVSEADLAGARELCPSTRLRYVPNVVDVAGIAPVTPAIDECRAVFVASFAYQPNRDAMRFLLDEVFPRVWAELPAARLALVGSGLHEPPSTDPRIETHGFVENLSSIYARSSCAVVPLLQSGGTPLKFIEALAYGLPVLATPRAAAGLDVRDGEHCLIAESAVGFAAALVRILRDGAPELGPSGRRLVADRYSIEALRELLRP